MAKSPAIGIDIGTSYCSIAVWEKGNVKIIPNDQENRRIPSYVAFTDDEYFTGDSAKAQVIANPTKTIFDIKRLIGRKCSEASIEHDLKFLPFNVVDNDGRASVKLNYQGQEKIISLVEIYALLLTELKELAEEYLGVTVKNVVISIPACFKDCHRQATRDAALAADLNLVQLINEPTAAVLAYGMQKGCELDRNVLIFNLGGGSLDVSVVKFQAGTLFEVKSTASEISLGGNNFDYCLANYLADEFEERFHKDLRTNSKSLCKLRMAAQNAKRNLSCSTETTIEIDAIFEGIDFRTKITRTKFEEICSNLFYRILNPVDKALIDAKLDADSIDNVILVGGSVRIPKVQELLQNYFDGKTLDLSLNLNEAVVQGATIQAAIINRENHPKLQQILSVDVTTSALGISSGLVGNMAKVIECNQPIPLRESQMFTTYENNQANMALNVFEGEHDLCQENNLIATYELQGISPAPAGVPQIEVSLDLDVDGILTVNARNEQDGNFYEVITRSNNRLSRKVIEAIKSDLHKFLESKKQHKKKLEARNKLEEYIFQIKRLIETCANKLSVEEKSHIEKECDKNLDWLDITDLVDEYEYEEKQSKLSSICTALLSK